LIIDWVGKKWRTGKFIDSRFFRGGAVPAPGNRSICSEADFLNAEGRKLRLLVEAKYADTHPEPFLKKYQDFLQVPAVQLVEELEGYRLLSNKDQRILR
jgi:hypothetical protein